MLLAHGVSIDIMVELINSVLATVTVERLARAPIEVTRVMITQAGREALDS